MRSWSALHALSRVTEYVQLDAECPTCGVNAFTSDVQMWPCAIDRGLRKQLGLKINGDAEDGCAEL